MWDVRGDNNQGCSLRPLILVPEESSDAESKIELSGENCVL